MDLVGRDIYGHRERPFCHLQGAMPPFLCGSDSEDLVPSQEGGKAGGKPSLQGLRAWTLCKARDLLCWNWKQFAATQKEALEREAGAPKKGKN